MAIRLDERLRLARTELYALAAALRHPRTPRAAKVVAFVVLAYALSPIDLIPDVIPVLGLLDDAILVPLGVLLARRMIPSDVLVECRELALAPSTTPRWLRRCGIAVVVATWIGAALPTCLLVRWIVEHA